MDQKRDAFSSKIGFILSAIGFAIGMGTFWRFPYLCGNNGGALFLLLYIIAMLLIALPLFALEVAMGSAAKKDAVGTYKELAPGKPWYLNGYMNVLAMIFICGSTLPIGGWVLVYVARAITGGFLGLTPQEIVVYYDTHVVNNPIEVNAWVVLLIVVMGVILRKSLDKGLEIANKICMPLLLLIMVILSIRAMTLPGAGPGIDFVFSPDFSKLNGKIILLAVGQAFYAVGVAMAVSIVFGSYMQSKDRQIIKNTLAVGSGIIFAALCAGMIIFPCVFAFGLQPDAGPELIFITMPNIFDQMPFGHFFAILFYILFLLAAFSTWIAGYEAINATLRDQFSVSKNTSVFIGGVILLVCSIISANSSSLLLIMDNAVGYLLTIGAFIAAMFGTWVWGLDKFYALANVTNPTAQKSLTILIKYIIPVVIVVLVLQVAGIIS